MLRVVAAKQSREIADHDAARSRNYELAQLIAVAFHKPGKMPKFKPTRSGRAGSDRVARAEREAADIRLRINAQAAARRGR